MTIKDYDSRPETRVFRLDTECYIIYLGRNGNDYKPFLRIGNTPDLPAPVIANTLSIILTDRLTGNPAFENANISEMELEEIRYLGDPDLVEKFKTFVKKANLHTEGFEEYHGDEEATPNGSFVYFHTDGNMTVYFGRDKIFDLRERERRDVHFIEQAKRIRSQYIKNQLRYREEDLKSPGFVFLGERAVLFRDGRIIVPTLPPDFFPIYTKAGLDPDQIALVMDDALTESLSHLFKRKRSKQDAVAVLTSDVPLISSAADLFAVKKQEALTAHIVDFGSGACEVDKVRLTRSATSLSARFDGLDLDVVIQSAPGTSSPGTGAALVLDPRGNTAVFLSGRRRDTVTLFASTPISVSLGSADVSRLAERVFAGAAQFYEAVFPPDIFGVVESINQGISGLVSGSDGGRLRQAETRLRDMLRADAPYLRPYLLSLDSYLRMAKNGEFGLNVDRSVSAASTGVSRILRELEPSQAPQFLCGQLIVGEIDTYIFYYPAKSNVTHNMIDRSAVVNGKIDEEIVENRDTYGAERQRLLDLIAQLNIPQAKRKGSRTEKSPEDAETAEKPDDRSAAKTDKTAAAAAADKAPTPAAGSGAEQRPTNQQPRAASRQSDASGDRSDRPALSPAVTGTVSGGAVTRSGDGRRTGRRIGIAALIAVLLAALVFAIVRFIPGLKRGEPSVASRTNAESTQTPGSASGAESGTASATSTTPSAGSESSTRTTSGNTESGAGTTGSAGVGIAASQGTSPGATGTAASQGTSPGATGTAASPGAAPGTTGNATSQSGAQSATSQGAGNETGSNDQTTASATNPGSAASQTGIVPSRELQDLADHLNINGVQVTVLDLIKLTNYIATHNGFRAMGNLNTAAGRDPDVIYPGDSFVLPDGTGYTAREHDTIWYIAADYLRALLTARTESYQSLLQQYGNPPTTADGKSALIARLQALKSESFSENFDRMVDAEIRSLQS